MPIHLGFMLSPRMPVAFLKVWFRICIYIYTKTKTYHRHHGSEPAGLAPRVYTQPLCLSHPQLFVTKIRAEKPPKVPLKGLPSVAISRAPDDPAQQCSGRDPGAANREQYKTSDFTWILLTRKLGHKVNKSSNRRQLEMLMFSDFKGKLSIVDTTVAVGCQY